MGRNTLAVLLLLAAAAPSAAVANETDDYQQLRAQAVAAVAEAAKLRGEWRDTGKLLEEADKAAAAGEYKKANALAEQARREGELGHIQALAERNAGDSAYVR